MPRPAQVKKRILKMQAAGQEPAEAVIKEHRHVLEQDTLPHPACPPCPTTAPHHAQIVHEEARKFAAAMDNTSTALMLPEPEAEHGASCSSEQPAPPRTDRG